MADEDSEESGAGHGSTVDTLPRKTGRSEHATSRARRVREPPGNSIEPSRKPKRSQNSQAIVAVAEGPAAPSTPSAPVASPTRRADTDPWTVPQSVRDRFVQDGHRFYFPDGAPAFKDRGRRLTTTSENTQVVHSLIEIAHSRGWTEVTVSGTERFREEAWRQARLAGLAVRGFRPTDEQQAQLIRALARNIARSTDAISAEARPPAPGASQQPDRQRPAPDFTRERVVGRLLEHGKDAYRHDPNEEPSYFVRIQTRDGAREVWGKDIERAVAKSLTQPQIGDEVVLQRTGRDAVTVKRQQRDAQGQLDTKEVDTYRNRWAIEKKEFFEQRAAAAQTLRDEMLGPREAVRQHPELAGTYLNLRAAELASKALRDPEDRRRFVMQVRTALSDDIERGEPLQPVRLRERAATKARSSLTRE